MPDITWRATTGTDGNIAANWSTGALPTSSDVVIFDNTAVADCIFTTLNDRTFQKIKIMSNFARTVTFGSQTITLTDGIGLEIYVAGKLKADSGSVFDFTGTPDGVAYSDDGTTTGQPKHVIKIDSTNDTDLNTSSTGMFDTSGSRSNTTFVFKNTSSSLKMYLMNGVYPHLTFEPTAATTLDTRNTYETYTASAVTTLTTLNKFGKVSMLNLNVSDTDITVQAQSHTFDDLNKIYKIKGSIVGIGASIFDWGYATLELEPTANSTLPTTGNTTFGSSTSLFKAHYHKLVIDESSTGSYYYKIASNQRLYCNELEVNGRLYGDADYNDANGKTAEIHTMKSPIISGDWNFQQISDGVYRVRGTEELLPTANGGTGLRSGFDYFLLHPLYFTEANLDTNTDRAFNIPNEIGGAYPSSHPMPFSGVVKAVAFAFTGTISGTASNTFSIRRTLASDSSTTDLDFSFAANTLNNNNTKIITGSGVEHPFSAGDKVSLRRKTGTTDFNNAQATVWVQFD